VVMSRVFSGVLVHGFCEIKQKETKGTESGILDHFCRWRNFPHEAGSDSVLSHIKGQNAPDSDFES
jgi:hypothetical protein